MKAKKLHINIFIFSSNTIFTNTNEEPVKKHCLRVVPGQINTILKQNLPVNFKSKNIFPVIAAKEKTKYKRGKKTRVPKNTYETSNKTKKDKDAQKHISGNSSKRKKIYKRGKKQEFQKILMKRQIKQRKIKMHKNIFPVIAAKEKKNINEGKKQEFQKILMKRQIKQRKIKMHKNIFPVIVAKEKKQYVIAKRY